MTEEQIKEDLEKEFGIMTDYFNHRPGYFKLMAEWIIKHREEYADMQVKEAIDKLPGALEIQAHAKALNEEDFRDYMNEFLGKKLEL